MFTEAAASAVGFWASVSRPVFGSFISIFMHASARHTDRDTILMDHEIILIGKMSGMPGVEIDKGGDVFPSAVSINGVSIMGRIQKELFHTEFRKVCSHCEKGMKKRKHVMPGGPF